MALPNSPFERRSRWYRYLNEPSLENKVSVAISVFIATVIVLNIIEVIIGSIPQYGLQMKEWYWVSSQVLVVFFAIEYGMRIWVAAEMPHENKMRTEWQRRRDYIFSSMGLVDLFAFLPFALIFVLPSSEFSDLRILKLFAMARLLKLTRYSTSLTILLRVYQENKRILLAALFVILSLTFVAAAGVYIFEHKAQPVAFGSIPAAMWWALVTLTTVGYGDVTPITLGGKIFGSLVIVCGVGVAAMPAGIFASSFVQLIKEQERQRRRERREKKYQAVADRAKAGVTEYPQLHLELSSSEQIEVDYLMKEFDLTLDQAVGVVIHFRH
ncbi:ion transporter [Litoribrevibacter albus]|uniref:Potassium voltage gated channel, Shab-related subfamily, member 2 n=1 Tax=Litoribrevibacter albus TaxID=1473156 RepID=A0AA37SG60_9GAMM|nr:ion transporter [Litoribrevibacter albus]GLQ33649.1 potassium voltage gated channel, Shab-related subfamily, member 2 [Litoribrevibacter albus]